MVEPSWDTGHHHGWPKTSRGQQTQLRKSSSECPIPRPLGSLSGYYFRVPPGHRYVRGAFAANGIHPVDPRGDGEQTPVQRFDDLNGTSTNTMGSEGQRSEREFWAGYTRLFVDSLSAKRPALFARCSPAQAEGLPIRLIRCLYLQEQPNQMVMIQARPLCYEPPYAIRLRLLVGT
jgi:hypothetical protein